MIVIGLTGTLGAGKDTVVNYLIKNEDFQHLSVRKFLIKELQKRNDRDSMFILNGFAQNYFSEILWKDDEGRSVGMSYFKERGFQDDIIRKFGLGYSLEKYNALADTAQSKGYKKEFLLKTGLCAERGDGKIADRFRGRVMFPVHSISGKIVAFGGRILKTDEKTAKYVNSPESEIYHKSNELYGIYFAKQHSQYNTHRNGEEIRIRQFLRIVTQQAGYSFKSFFLTDNHQFITKLQSEIWRWRQINTASTDTSHCTTKIFL